MKMGRLLTVALGMIACTHLHSNDTGMLKDSATVNGLLKHPPAIPVVNNKKTVINTAPDLPFYKDVMDPKRLFW